MAEVVWLVSEYTDYEGGGVDEVFADYELGLAWLGAKREKEIAEHTDIFGDDDDFDLSFIPKITEEDGLAYVDIGSTRYSVQRWEPVEAPAQTEERPTVMDTEPCAHCGHNPAQHTTEGCQVEDLVKVTSRGKDTKLSRCGCDGYEAPAQEGGE